MGNADSILAWRSQVHLPGALPPHQPPVTSHPLVTPSAHRRRPPARPASQHSTALLAVADAGQALQGEAG